MSSSSPIAIIDSGMAGLSVARILRDKVRREQIIYLADTARGPYAGRSSETIMQGVRQMIGRARELEPKLMVLTCNASAGTALPSIRREFDHLSICGIVDATARAAAQAAGARESPVIGVLASEATIRSKAYERAVHRRRHHARLLLQPIPLLEAAVEEGRDQDDPLLRQIIRQYVKPMAEFGTNVIVLGSCHCSGMRPMIRKIVSEEIALIDSAECCAEDVMRRLTCAGRLKSEGEGGIECVLTDQTPRFRWLSKRFLGEELEKVQIAPLEELFGKRDRESPAPWRASA